MECILAAALEILMRQICNCSAEGKRGRKSDITAGKKGGVRKRR